MGEMREEQLDYHMWLMGLYVTNAVSVAVSNALNGKKSRARYLSEPILRSGKREKERSPEEDFTRFAAWAVVYNENFRKKNGQG